GWHCRARAAANQGSANNGRAGEVNPLYPAILAQRVYSDAPTIGDANSASRIHVYGDVHAFRGTDNLAALLADADGGTTAVWGLGRIYDGFYAALAAVLPACLAVP